MAIVKMKKFTLLAFESYKSSLLKELQKFEDVHFKNLQDADLEELNFLNKDSAFEMINRHEAELNKIKFVINKIEPYVAKPKGLKAFTEAPQAIGYDEFDVYPDKYDYNAVYETVKSEDEKLNAIKSKITSLRAENDNLRSWTSMDVAVSELSRLKFVKWFVGTVSKVSSESFKTNVSEQFKTAYVEFLGNIKDDTIVFIVVPNEEYENAFTLFKTLGFTRMSINFAGIPAKIMKANNDEIDELQASRDVVSSNIANFSVEFEKLQIVHDYYETLLERERACQNFLKMRTTVLIEGWVPAEEEAEFKGIIDRICGNEYYLEAEDVDKDCEEVPVKLKNNAVVSAFEDVTLMFSVPRYNEIDPTPLLMPFYLVFFGLMLGDVGYGLILLIATSVALKFFNLKEGSRKFIKFFFFLSLTTIVAGILYSSMFGFSFFEPIRMADGTYKAIISSDFDLMTMMLGSVAMGVVQVLFGICVKGYMLVRDGKWLDAIFDSLFWLIALVSGIGLLLSIMGMMPDSIKTIVPWVFALSLVALAATQGRENATLVGKIAGGVYAVYGMSSYVGDFVSYTRIAALALAGAYIGGAFNMMFGLVPAGPLYIVKIVFGGAILLVGHAINIGLSALGAYVHTCRLQYVEYFGKFFDGGGIPFNAFKMKNKYITINK